MATPNIEELLATGADKVHARRAQSVHIVIEPEAPAPPPVAVTLVELGGAQDDGAQEGEVCLGCSGCDECEGEVAGDPFAVVGQVTDAASSYAVVVLDVDGQEIERNPAASILDLEETANRYPVSQTQVDPYTVRGVGGGFTVSVALPDNLPMDERDRAEIEQAMLHTAEVRQAGVAAMLRLAMDFADLPLFTGGSVVTVAPLHTLDGGEIPVGTELTVDGFHQTRGGPVVRFNLADGSQFGVLADELDSVEPSEVDVDVSDLSDDEGVPDWLQLGEDDEAGYDNLPGAFDDQPWVENEGANFRPSGPGGLRSRTTPGRPEHVNNPPPRAPGPAPSRGYAPEGGSDTVISPTLVRKAPPRAPTQESQTWGNWTTEMPEQRTDTVRQRPREEPRVAVLYRRGPEEGWVEVASVDAHELPRLQRLARVLDVRVANPIAGFAFSGPTATLGRLRLERWQPTSRAAFAAEVRKRAAQMRAETLREARLAARVSDPGHGVFSFTAHASGDGDPVEAMAREVLQHRQRRGGAL